MTREDVEDIQSALDEMGLMLTDIIDYDTKPLWTLHQRKLYERATFVLNEERKIRATRYVEGEPGTSPAKIQQQA